MALLLSLHEKTVGYITKNGFKTKHMHMPSGSVSSFSRGYTGLQMSSNYATIIDQTNGCAEGPEWKVFSPRATDFFTY